jgi:hypothetical protein
MEQMETEKVAVSRSFGEHLYPYPLWCGSRSGSELEEM